MVVDPLPQQLNGRLCSILLLLRHVEVVHKDNGPLTHGRSKHSLTPPMGEQGNFKNCPGGCNKHACYRGKISVWLAKIFSGVVVHNLTL